MSSRIEGILPLWLASASFLGYSLHSAMTVSTLSWLPATIITVLLLSSMRWVLVDSISLGTAP